MKKTCGNSDECRHKKCECGHCKDFHVFNKDECIQLDRKTLTQCPCKRFTP